MSDLKSPSLSEPSRAPALGIMIPCRNEAPVIERKLRNLARCTWPRAARPHRVLVIDDGSEDGTAGWVQVAAQRHFDAAGAPVEVRVIANDLQPGKPGAVTRGIRELGADVDLLVLTDADVVLESGCLVALVEAFESDERLSMACGVQRFVHHVPGDGSVPAVENNAAAGLYDRITARVRAIESRCGRLFSVHGQLLAWRRTLELEPDPGIAADDLDLLLQLRGRQEPTRVRALPGAVFFETKPTGEIAGRQALRRARAYVQALSRQRTEKEPDLVGRMQTAFYRFVPLWAPELLALGLFLTVALMYAYLAAWVPVLFVSLIALMAALTPGRGLMRLMRIIRHARRCERVERLNARWEMARG